MRSFDPAINGPFKSIPSTNAVVALTGLLESFSPFLELVSSFKAKSNRYATAAQLQSLEQERTPAPELLQPTTKLEWIQNRLGKHSNRQKFILAEYQQKQIILSKIRAENLGLEEQAIEASENFVKQYLTPSNAMSSYLAVLNHLELMFSQASDEANRIRSEAFRPSFPQTVPTEIDFKVKFAEEMYRLSVLTIGPKAASFYLHIPECREIYYVFNDKRIPPTNSCPSSNILMAAIRVNEYHRNHNSRLELNALEGFREAVRREIRSCLEPKNELFTVLHDALRSALIAEKISNSN